MLCTRRASIRVVDYYFNERVAPAEADIVRYNQWSFPVPDCQCQEFYTIVLDLTATTDELFERIKRGTRYDIRRAAKENITYTFYCNPTPVIIDEFCHFYDTFAASKRLAGAPRKRMLVMAQCNALRLSSVKEDTETLVWHAYLTVEGRARLLHSASLYQSDRNSVQRQTIGRANRFQHWQDLLQLQSMGIGVLDLGGWYPGTVDAKLLQINKFKEEFGGHIVREFNCIRANTMKGRCVLWLRSLM